MDTHPPQRHGPNKAGVWHWRPSLVHFINLSQIRHKGGHRISKLSKIKRDGEILKCHFFTYKNTMFHNHCIMIKYYSKSNWSTDESHTINLPYWDYRLVLQKHFLFPSYSLVIIVVTPSILLDFLILIIFPCHHCHHSEHIQSTWNLKQPFAQSWQLSAPTTRKIRGVYSSPILISLLIKFTGKIMWVL